jgi:hypothetical protein
MSVEKRVVAYLELATKDAEAIRDLIETARTELLTRP